MDVITTQECYSDDWRRTDPDFAVFLPTEPSYHPEAADHFLVDYTPRGDLLAILTVCSRLDGADFSVVHMRSNDGGVSWSTPAVIDGPGRKPGQVAAYGFPVISRSGRIYCFYHKSTGIGDSLQHSHLRCKYSDDDGYTWNDGGVDFPFRRSKYDHPDPTVLPQCIVWQKPIRDSKGRLMVGVSHWTSSYLRPRLMPNVGGKEIRSEFFRFDNIDEGPDPKDLKLTWLQNDDTMVEVPAEYEPAASDGRVFAFEPAPTLLPDGRLFLSIRTGNGNIWYSVSEDDGETWRQTEVLRYRDGGEPILNPDSPAPIYGLEDGRYILFMQNHDGYGHGGQGPFELNARRPQFLAVGEFQPGAHQPIWFSEPLLFADTQNVGVFPLYFKWLSMYASLTERDGQRTFWYTDRKIFALGRHITDEMLAGLTIPSP
jgi:hypothetical protein